MKNHFYTLLFLCCFCLNSQAQTASVTKWWNPATHDFPVIEGQVWGDEVGHPYDRLPARAEALVRKPVWGLSRHAAGLMIRFRSNASQIVVRYGVGSRHAMPHMPATGVSGVDLYAIDSDGNGMWSRGRYTFGDTITYRFNNLKPNDRYHNEGREYRLYLPLYNSVEWMEIGVAEEALFKPLPVRLEKPIVVYGTSIAQGACASRPGMAWTNILGRKLDRPLINLAFSGNGRLEEEVSDLLVEIDPKIFVIDCLPNLVNAKTYDEKELTKRILSTIRKLKEKRPDVPILLTEHAGYTDGFISPNRKEGYERVNRIQKATFGQLKAEGLMGIHYLSRAQIGLQLDDMVDGTHPNDLGMMHYAEGYEKALRKILKEPLGKASTSQVCTQYREPGNYDWEERHRAILEGHRTDPPKTVFLANSIVHFWGGLPRSPLVREEESWASYLTPLGVRNYAYGWDRIENVLWRVYHDELDGFAAEKVLIMIGTNNLHLNTNEEVLEGLALLVDAVKTRQPSAKLVLMGLLPRRDYEERILTLNLSIAQLAAQANISYGDMGGIFLQEDGKIKEGMFSDGLHPNAMGYEQLREVLLPIVKK